MLRVTEKTWIIADTHFGHANIVKYCKRPRNHNTLMIENWKKLVKPNDVILHMGDVAIWYDEYAADFWAKRAAKLPGIKYLILGNHDKHYTNAQWKKYGFEVIKPFQQNKLYFSHEATKKIGTWEVNIHGHSHQHAPFGIYEGLGCRYYNASIEGMRYKPVRMKTILKHIVKV